MTQPVDQAVAGDPPEHCWEFREIDGKLYRVNPCNGRIQLIGDVVPQDPAP